MYPRSPLESIQKFHQELTLLRRDLHANPESGFQEVRTASIVAGALEALGIEVHRGVGRTGVVGVIRGQRHDSGRSIGLRADMDALPIKEEGVAQYCSTVPGLMHACGHDGHTAILQFSVCLKLVNLSLSRLFNLPLRVKPIKQPEFLY
jgi:hippurate hydrolase